jgi:hypothetical protein
LHARGAKLGAALAAAVCWRAGELWSQYRFHPAASRLPGDRLSFVAITEPCNSAALDKAIAKIGTMDFMLETPLCLQILVVDDQDTD